jgi:hypothetical protein
VSPTIKRRSIMNKKSAIELWDDEGEIRNEMTKLFEPFDDEIELYSWEDSYMTDKQCDSIANFQFNMAKRTNVKSFDINLDIGGYLIGESGEYYGMPFLNIGLGSSAQSAMMFTVINKRNSDKFKKFLGINYDGMTI